MRATIILLAMAFSTPVLAQSAYGTPSSTSSNQQTSRSEEAKAKAQAAAKQKRYCMMNPISCRSKYGTAKPK